LVLAIGVVAVLTAISLTAPPFIGYDPAYGWLRWQSFLAGAPFDTVLEPDAADIARDTLARETWWSPGQYLVPGLLTLLGLRLGTAVVIIGALSNLAMLFGWLAVLRAFGLGGRVAMAAVACMATLRWSTSVYGLNSGGEVLLQAVTPWIVLAAVRLPRLSAPAAAAIAFLVVGAAFVAKLNGIIVAVAAFAAVGVTAWTRERRPTAGLIHGAAGVLIAVAANYAFWYRGRAQTHVGGGGDAFDMIHVLFAVTAPWTSALAWQDLLAWLLQRPGAELIASRSVLIGLFMAPFAAALAFVTLRYRAHDKPEAEPEAALRRFALLFAGFFTLAMLLLYALRAPLPLEERHYRPAGMLILLCLLTVALRPSVPRAVRTVLAALLFGMSLYGLASFTARAIRASAAPRDPLTWTIQQNADAEALAALRAAFAREGGDAVFYLAAPELATALPPGARVFVGAPDLIAIEKLAASRRAGRAKGSVYVLVGRALPDDKVRAILGSFTAYDPARWQKTEFERAVMYRQ
jgi:hypothetical protein